ncbi:HTH domain-containing protein [bacterium]|nr:HTH domain-containing protein [bacterium]
MPEPEFIEMPQTFIINLYRKSFSYEADKNTIVSLSEYKNDGNNMKNDSDNLNNDGDNLKNDGDIIPEIINKSNIKSIILKLISVDNKISSYKISKALSVSKSTIERHIRKLIKNRKLKRIGSPRGGSWEIIKSKLNP